MSGDQAGSHHSVGLAEQLGDLYCKVGCYSKALEAYQAQVMNFFFLNLLTLCSFWIRRNEHVEEN